MNGEVTKIDMHPAPDGRRMFEVWNYTDETGSPITYITDILTGEVITVDPESRILRTSHEKRSLNGAARLRNAASSFIGKLFSITEEGAL